MMPIHNEILDRWVKGQTSKQIQFALKMSRDESVRVVVQRARAAGDPRAIRRTVGQSKFQISTQYPPCTPIGRVIHHEAAVRGITVNELFDRIVRTLASDNLISAVIDDGEGA